MDQTAVILRSCVPVPKIEDDSYDWWERHECKCEAVRSKKFRIVFIGDSITHFWTRESATQYGGGDWEKRYGNSPVLNLGFGFDRTQNVLWRIDHGELEGQNPELFVVNIGTNQFSITERYSGDTPETAAAGVMQTLTALRERFPKAKIIDMALFPRGGKMESIRRTNAILAKKVPLLSNTVFLDIAEDLALHSGEPDPANYQPDLCHLNQRGYEHWGERLAPYVSKILQADQQ